MKEDEASKFIKRISPEAEQGRSKGGSLLIEATRIAGGSQITGIKDKISEPLNRKERADFNQYIRPLEEIALIEWVAVKDLSTEAIFLDTYGRRKIGEGAEQQVYLSLQGFSVIKANDAIMHGTWLEFFDRLAVHNWLFPETGYLLIGFTFVKERLAAIIEQPFIISSRGASRNEVEQDLGLRGFIRMRNDDYYHPELGIILEDLHDENVLISDKGMLFYFDPIPYLETPEMKLTGKYIHHFPFNFNVE